MATINNAAPAPAAESNNGMGFLLGVVVLIMFAFFMLYYGLPLLRNSVGSAAPSVNVPSKVDVNVKGAK